MAEHFINLVYIFKGGSEAQLKTNLSELMQHVILELGPKLGQPLPPKA